MKTIVFVIGALLSVSAAHAGEYSHYSRVNFQSASTWVPSNKVCLSNGNIYHKTKATITVTDCDHGTSNCVTQTRRLEQPMVSTAQRCAQFRGDDCVAYETYTLKQGPTATVQIYSSFKAYEDGRTPNSTQKFTIPACN